jgi:cytidylate kinase
MINVSYLSDRLAHRARVARMAGPDLARQVSATAPETPALTIAIAREAGTPANEIAREVGARLGWPVYNHELLERLSEDLHVPIQQLEYIDERGVSWLLEAIQGFSLTSDVSEETYVHRLVALIRFLGARSRCIIVGRGAAQLLPAEATLRVRLVGDLEDRIAAMSRKLHLDRKQAARLVSDRNRERIRFVRDHFLKDPTAPDSYDLVLNTSVWSPTACAALIEQSLVQKSRSLAATDEE